MKTIRASVDYTIQRASEETSKRFRRPLGVIEILDSDGFRQDWAETEEEAEVKVAELIEDALGLSGGVGLGYVLTEVLEPEQPHDPRESDLRTVGEYFFEVFSEFQVEEYIDESVPMQLHTNCGKDCREAIDSASEFMHFANREGLLDVELRTAMIDSTRQLVETYIYG